MDSPNLDGVTVVETAGHVAGPFAGCLLADLGARVVKVERPGSGDPHRGRNPHHDLYSPSFRALNRGKESLALDLDRPGGPEVLRRLLATADVFIENFRPATRRRLGLDYGSLAAENPGLVHCTISGFGETGPYAGRPCFDTVAQALSGTLSLVTDLGAPRPIGVSLADHCAGLYAAYGCLGALLVRTRTGCGQHIEASLLRTVLSFVESHIADHLNEGTETSQESFARGRIFTFIAGDGLPFVVHLSGHDGLWRAFVSACGRADLVGDPRFSDRRGRAAHHHELAGELQASIAGQGRAHWLEALDAAGVACAPAYTLPEALADPQVRHMGIPLEMADGETGTTRLVGGALELSLTQGTAPRRAPLLGEHTEAVLARLGYRPGDVAALRQEGVVALRDAGAAAGVRGAAGEARGPRTSDSSRRSGQP